jgi:hypothetical protein
LHALASLQAIAMMTALEVVVAQEAIQITLDLIGRRVPRRAVLDVVLSRG